MLFSRSKPSSSQLEEKIAKTLLTEREKVLLQLLFCNGSSSHGSAEETVRFLTHNLDIDNESAYYMIQLAGWGRQNGWEFFPEQDIPRFKGLHRYHQAHNAMGMPWLMGKIEALRNAGIPVMIIKGLAMRLYYAPDTPRIMWDYDIAVPENRFDQAMALMQGEDALHKRDDHHSKTLIGILKGNNVELDVHCFIFKTHGEQGTDIWERAVPFDLNGLDVLTLCPEDMLIHQLDTHARNYFRNELPENRIKWFIDVHKIAEAAPVDGASLYARSKEFGVEYPVRLMLNLYKRCMPEDGLVSSIAIPDEGLAGYERWLPRAYGVLTKKLAFDELDLPVGYHFTPRLLLATTSKSLSEYWVYRSGEHVPKQYSSFVRFMLWRRNIHSPRDLYNTYLSRLFKAKPVPESYAKGGA